MAILRIFSLKWIEIDRLTNNTEKYVCVPVSFKFL